MVGGNEATVLQNGDAFFPAMLEAIRGARRSINLEIYIFNEGDVGSHFAQALAERARAGVEVRVLIDGLGSHPGGLEPMMRKAGVHVRVYHPLRVYSIYRVGNRTHRRILTVDGEIGFCGGAAIDDRWRGDARNPREWRDTVMRVVGPVVGQLQAVFIEDWVITTGEVLNGDAQFPKIASVGDGARPGGRVVADGPELDGEAPRLHGDPGRPRANLDRERLLRPRPADPTGLDLRRAPRRRRQGHRARRAHRHPGHADGIAVLLR